MKLILKHKYLSIVISIILVIAVLISIYAYNNRGVITVTYKHIRFHDIMCVMTIKSDGSVITEYGIKSKFYSDIGIGIPSFKTVIKHVETTISNEDYEYIKGVIYKKDRPNLKDALSTSDCTFEEWYETISTTDRWYEFVGSRDPLGQDIVGEFMTKLREIRPIDLNSIDY